MAGTSYVTDFTINRSGDVAPVATAQSVSVAENASTQVVLAATDTQGNPLTYSIVTAPTDGALSAITNGNTLTYTPAANFYGADSFVFQATDPDGKSSQATVSVTVTPVNLPPVAIAQSLSVIHDAPQVIVLSGTDNNETPASQLTYTITTEPAHGTLVQSTTSPDTFTYTPAAGYLGTDSFAFTVTDTGNPPGNLANAMTSAPASVSLDVVDPPPVGVPVSYTTRENVPLTVPAAQGVLASDTDSAGDPLTATLTTTVTHGTLVLNGNGSFIYTPPASFTGSVFFTYVPHGTYTAGSATTVTIVVGEGAGAPPPLPPPPGPGKLASAPPGLPDPPAPSGTGDLALLAPSGAGELALSAPSEASGTSGSGGASAVVAAAVPPVGTPVTAPSSTTIPASGGSIPTSPAPVVAQSSPVVLPDTSGPTADPDLDPAGLLSVPDPVMPPDTSDPGTDLDLDPLGLLAVPDAIVLPDTSGPATGPDANPAGLLSVPDPIVLPDFTLAGD